MLQVGSNWSPSRSGLDRYYNGLLGGLTDNRAEHSAIAYDSSDICSGNPRYMSFGSSQCGVIRQTIQQFFHLKPLIADVDLVVSHCTPSIYPGLPWLAGTPMICHFHGPRFQERALQGSSHLSCVLSRHIETSVYRRARHFIVLSEYMCSILKSEFSVPETRVSIVPGGIDLNYYRPVESKISARERLGIPIDRFVITAVRRLDRRMGLDNLVLAMQAVVSAHPNALLLIYGEGALQHELAHLIEVNSLSEHAKLVGFVPDSQLAAVYRSADLTVMPTSDLEGFGMSILESLASGTPVMGTPVGAIPEVLAPLSASLIFDSIHAHDIADGINRAIANRKGLPDEAACLRYAEKYSWTLISGQVLDVYQKVLNEPCKGSGDSHYQAE